MIRHMLPWWSDRKRVADDLDWMIVTWCAACDALFEREEDEDA